eukprot:TRINITY_DN772_c0_g1_i1.p1 TRINITY_DN772_c0_g1~~TRINITY_DN772_c0_g1_i1.p1  ORF type:complete len:330 (+),score=79.13 TRINITY_DN772_c0_g1_i1:132-1121(+)
MHEPTYVVAATSKDKAREKEEHQRVITGKDVLTLTRISEIKRVLQPGGLVEVKASDSVVTSFQKLIGAKILSVPIYDQERRKYIGFLDVLDILHFFLKELTESELSDGFDALKERFSKKKCKDIRNISESNAYRPVENSAPLNSAIDLMLQYHVRRVPIINSEGDLVSILTQSRLLQHLAEEVQKFSFCQSSVEELKLGYKTVTSVTSDTPVKDAYEMMLSQNISGVAVVDSNGKLVGSLSVTDLRVVGFNTDLLKKMLLSVGDFVAAVAANKQHSIYSITPDSKISSVVNLFQVNQLHRVFVVDPESGKPIGVISLNDLLRLFASENK